MSIHAMMTLLRNKRLLVVAAIAASAGSLVLLLLSGSKATAQPQIPASQTAAASAVVQGVLPGSTSTLVLASALPRGLSSTGIPGFHTPSTTANIGAEQLQISVPANTVTAIGSSSAVLVAPASPGTETTDSAAYELGWHAALAAGLAGLSNTNIVGYTVAVPGKTFTAAEQGSLQGLVRTTVGSSENGGALANIGTVPYQALLAQLQSNLKVLEGALPRGTVLASDAFAVPAPGLAADYGFEVDLKVSSLASLQGYVGDIVDGLGTGLTGGPTAPTEGVAINIVDGHGRRVGWWSASRVAAGSAIGDPVLPVAGGTETTIFPNLTGGPAPTASASGAPAVRAPAKGYALYPTRGIGPVWIGETKARAERALNVKTGVCGRPCLRTYRSTHGVLHVNFLDGEVNGIESTSPQITLDGMRLGLGLRRFKKILRHWTSEVCQGYIYGSGPSTSISFGGTYKVEINVARSRLGGCGLP